MGREGDARKRMARLSASADGAKGLDEPQRRMGLCRNERHKHSGNPQKWDGKILVPFAVESALSGVGRLLNPDEFLWYTRTINCNPKRGERILLHFGGVDFRTMVFVGHAEVTDVPHEGGQTPFTLDITDYVKSGDNTLTVCVWDPTEDFVNSRGKQSFKPKGCFYTRVSGIWQTVWMETVPESYIESYKCTTDIDNGEVRFDFKVAGPETDEDVKIDIYDGDVRVASAEKDADKPVFCAFSSALRRKHCRPQFVQFLPWFNPYKRNAPPVG